MTAARAGADVVPDCRGPRDRAVRAEAHRLMDSREALQVLVRP